MIFDISPVAHVRGGRADAVNGTPVVDIKPVMREFLPRGDIRQPDWASELMAGYWEPEPVSLSGC